MDTQKMLLSTLVGAVIFFILGFLFYATMLSDFFSNNMGSATGVAKQSPSLPLIFLGHLCLAFLIAYIYERWAGIRTFVTGAKTGALIGLLVALVNGCILLGTTNVGTPTTLVVDAVIQLVMGAIGGGVIGLLLGRGRS